MIKIKENEIGLRKKCVGEKSFLLEDLVEKQLSSRKNWRLKHLGKGLGKPKDLAKRKIVGKVGECV